ncbi:hypothetical protein Ancab_012175 [Ancistrocladus abbreviatus]
MGISNSTTHALFPSLCKEIVSVHGTYQGPTDPKGICFLLKALEWPLLAQALEGGSFDVLVDSRLEDYNSFEMAQMIACATPCVHHLARRCPQMSQVVQALEGNVSISELCKETTPGHRRVHGSADYDNNQ